MAVRLRILIGVCCALVIVSAPLAVRASFIRSVVDLVLSVTGTRVDQYSYRFFGSDGLDDLTDWPFAGRPFAESEAIGRTDYPPVADEVIRLRLGLRISRDALSAGNRAFKLQFGTLSTTCGAISSWTDVGAPASTAKWRGYDMPDIADGTSLGANLLSGATVLGSYEEQNPTPLNPEVPSGDIIEYDWILQSNIPLDNGATYCFRMVRSDGTQLDDYSVYPQIVTSIATQLSIHPSAYEPSVVDVQTGDTLYAPNSDDSSVTLIVPPFYSTASHTFYIPPYDLSNFLDSTGLNVPSGKLGASSRFHHMTAWNGDVATTSFDQPLTMQFHYLNSEIGSVVESSIKIYRLVGGVWTPLTTTIDAANNIATATITGFSGFSLFGDAAPTPTPTPTQQPGGGGGGAYVPPPTSADVILEGTGTPGTTVHVVKDGVETGTVTVLADASFSITLKGISAGTYQFGFWASDTQGRRSTTVTVSVPVSGTSTTLIRNIIIPPITITAPLSACGKRPDLNGDGKVNLVDFSIMAFWWRRTISEGANIDLNCDGRLTLADFSILAYFWTG